MRIEMGHAGHEGGCHRHLVQEINAAWSPKSSRKVWALDASTPVANSRLVEFVFGAWMAKTMPELQVQASTALSGWGDATVGNGLHTYSLGRLWRWLDLYRTTVPDVFRVPDDSGRKMVVPLGCYERAREHVVRTCNARFAEVSALVGAVPPTVEEYYALLGDMSLREVLGANMALGYFMCPDVSCRCNPRHVIRVKNHALVVEQVVGTQPQLVHCGGAKALLFHAGPETLLGEFLNNFGIALNGKALLQSLAVVDSQSSVALRDYSHPRGTFQFARALFGKRLVITTRIYLRDGAGKDLDWGCLDAFRANFQRIQEALSQVPVISDGRVIRIIAE